MSRRPAVLLGLVGAALGVAGNPAAGQTQPAIDTVIIERQDLFTEDRAHSDVFAQLFNDMHATTRSWVVRRELLFGPGDAYDSSLVVESERNLRALGIFRTVRIDTVRVGDALAVRVRTKDAWSLLPRANMRIASDGRLTGSFGVTETNVAGTGNRARLWYIRDADRDGFIASTFIRRIGRSRIAAAASWANLSDLDSGFWSVAHPFRSFSDRWSVFYGGEAFQGRVFQYRTETPTRRDTTVWRRRAFTNRVFYTHAPVATPERYIRVGASMEVRREEYLRAPGEALNQDSLFALVPDTVYGMFSAFVEYRRARFERMGRFNGFIDEDQDLSDLVFLSAKLAPGGWGYRETGIGGRIVLGSGVRAGPTLLKALVDANGLFNSGGLDSGRVVATGTIAVRTAKRHATFFQVSGGAMESPPPGGEFDLGFEVLPRLWGPHAFVGTRSVRFTFEHRFFAFDNIRDLIGLGVAAFADYGGAWFEDQDARLGGNVGLSFFFGSPLSSLAQVNHISGGYRFGGGIGASGASRWAFTAGSGIIF